MKKNLPVVLYLLVAPLYLIAQKGVDHDIAKRVISIHSQNDNLSMEINYADGLYISKLYIKGTNRLSSSGVYTDFSTDSFVYTSKNLLATPKISIHNNVVRITNILYGDGNNHIEEAWLFLRNDTSIEWKLTRTYLKEAILQDIGFPKWNFSNLSVWKGGIIDNGGVVWCKYLNTVNDTYGVHTGGTTFWDDKTGDALSVQAKASKGNHIATKYSHSPDGEFTSAQIVTSQPVKQRHDLSRFVHAQQDVFAPIAVKKGTISADLVISYVDYNKTYDRGDLKNINAAAVRELLNTTARYGVVDNNIVGGNGWITNWKCLHEPFFAQVALAVADSNYTKNLAATLDQERNLAMLSDGRVLSRWHNAGGDEIPGTFNDTTGYYEAMWGYTIDSQTGYVINVSDLFNINGNIAWLKGHQNSCRKALDWLIRRDSNNNGIFEMMNNNISEAKCSDWLDIVWASFENAFVNAQMYDALIKWAACERILKNENVAVRYETIAKRLKESFNKPIEDGGFWSATKNQFVYWRDKDGSVHGDNLVTPVQFMAIASGLCDDNERIRAIIHQIEERTAAEHLFHWPLCFDSFKREEVQEGNWPFPRYENGDIFPTWGYLGVKSYIHYDNELALKYIRNLLDQYQMDELSSQRYSRTTQQGLGGDILSGICTGVTALYSDIYGIQPRWNRLMIAPNLAPSLYGTNFHYNLRGCDYNIKLDKSNFQVSSPFYFVSCDTAFGVAGSKGVVRFFPQDRDDIFLSLSNSSQKPISLTVGRFNEQEIRFAIRETGKYSMTLSGLARNTTYELSADGSRKKIKSSKEGSLVIALNTKSGDQISLTRS